MSTLFHTLSILARYEDDGTYTLILDAPDHLPIELGSGFLSVVDCQKAIVATLTEPAVGNDLKELVDDLAPKVQELLDVQAQHDENQQTIMARLAEIEERLRSPLNPRPAPPRAPSALRIDSQRPNQANVAKASPTTLRRAAVQVPREDPDDPESSRRRGSAGNWDETNDEIIRPKKGGPIAPPTPGHPVAAPPTDRNAHSYEGQTPVDGFVPHQPMGGVTRGPGSK